jgi:hypothetical protein
MSAMSAMTGIRGGLKISFLQLSSISGNFPSNRTSAMSGFPLPRVYQQLAEVGELYDKVWLELTREEVHHAGHFHGKDCW